MLLVLSDLVGRGDGMFPQGAEQPVRPGVSQGTSSIQRCRVRLKVKPRLALVHSVSRGLEPPPATRGVQDSHLYRHSSAFNVVAIEQALRFCMKGVTATAPSQSSSV